MKNCTHRYTRWTVLALIIFILVSCSGQDAAQNKRMAEVKRNVGEAYMRQGNYTAALRELLDALKIYPDDPITHNDLGICYMNKKRLADAVSHFNRALAIKPAYTPARNNLGTAYLALKEWDTAITVFREITKDALYATPHFPLSNMGLAYYHKGDYKNALRYYKEALKIEERFVNALRGTGRTYLAMNEGRLALHFLTRAVKQAPKTAVIHYELGEANLMVGNIEQAMVSYETAMTLSSPESDVAVKAKHRRNSIRR